MERAEILATVIHGIIALIVLAAWLTIVYYFIKKWKRRKRESGSIIPPAVYGAWQGHNLGTTTMEPGELTRIERDLDRLNEKDPKE